MPKSPQISTLQKCKDGESIEDATLLIGSDEMMWRLILVWPKVSIEFDLKAKHKGRGRVPDWKRLWKGAQFDYEEISALSGYPIYMVRDAVLQAQMNFWIYPDNTVNQHALAFVKNGLAVRLKEFQGV